MSLQETLTVATVEEVGKRIANIDTSFVKRLLGQFSLLLGESFQRYLHNAAERYNEIRTLATEPELRPMIGPNGIYVREYLLYNINRTEKIISTETIEPVLKVGSRILIEGSAGIGKTMLMRYLLLNTMNRGTYIPVFLELRKIGRQLPDEISITDLIFDCMRDLDVSLPKECFSDSLRLGKYLFLMDGFDEIKESNSGAVAESIQAFSVKYPNNIYIVT